MTHSMKFRLTIVFIVILLNPFTASFANEAGQAKVDVKPGLKSDALKDGDAIKKGMPRSSRLDEQDRYRRLLEEYVQSYNKAESDEERIRLRKKFDKETREYRNSLDEEKKSLKKRDIEKEKQNLTTEYYKNLRRLEQDHDKEVRRLEQECRKDAFVVDKKWLPLESASCKKKSLIEEKFERRFKFLKDDYNASLRELQRK